MTPILHVLVLSLCICLLRVGVGTCAGPCRHVEDRSWCQDIFPWLHVYLIFLRQDLLLSPNSPFHPEMMVTELWNHPVSKSNPRTQVKSDTFHILCGYLGSELGSSVHSKTLYQYRHVPSNQQHSLSA